MSGRKGVAYGWCDVCKSKVATLVLSGRLRHHVRNGVRCDGSLHAPSAWPTVGKQAS